MDILSYLTTLIKTHKEVGIPGLGTIYKRKSPGRYDTDTHSFLPPSYTLGFTSDLKEQTLLTELISKEKNISVDSATYFVEQFSQHILDELSGHQESDFGDLGTFSTTSGSLNFIPKQDSNLGFDFYGLPALKTEPNTDKVEIAEAQAQVQEEVPASTADERPQLTPEQLELENANVDPGDGTEEEEEAAALPAAEPENDEQPVYEEIAEVNTRPETENTLPDPIAATPVPDTENVKPPVFDRIPAEPVTPEPEQPTVSPVNTQQEEPVHFTLDYTDAKKTGMPAYLKVVLGLIVLAVLGGIIYLAKPELFNGLVKTPSGQPTVAPDHTEAIKANDQMFIDSIAQADSLRKANERAILAADSAKDTITAKKPPVVPIAVTNNGAEITYEIIAASLLNQKEADNFLADMKKKGIPAKVADMPGRRVKISIGSFTDEETAKKELEVLKKTTKIPGIYIYKVRHTNNSK